MATDKRCSRVARPLLSLLLLAAAIGRFNVAAASLACTQCPNLGSQPVCANGQTFNNYCFAQCNGLTQYTFGGCNGERSNVYPYIYPNNINRNSYPYNYPFNYPNNINRNNYPYNYPYNYQIDNRNPASCNCPTSYQQVCAGGRTFLNDCQARCSGFQQYTLGACAGSFRYPFYRDSRSFYRNNFQNYPNCQCESNYVPVCAFNSASNTRSTYINACVATCSRASSITQGSC